jgi:hypothetical protein
LEIHGGKEVARLVAETKARVMAHDVFISHSSNNRPIANAVCAALESAGIRCWIAPRDVMPGRSYSGEITRAIQQSRAFILIFSQHSNNSEQVLREVQLAANSRLHIVQFRIDAVAPSDDLEYYLSGPHWLDAVTPPLENHLGQLTNSVKALLSLPRTEEDGQQTTPAHPRIAPISPAPVAQPSPPLPPIAPAIQTSSSTSAWKWVALGVGALAALGCVGLVIVFALLRPGTTATTTPAAPTSSPHSSAVVQPVASAKVNTETSPLPKESIVPSADSAGLSQVEAERFVKEFNREMEQGDLKSTTASLDETVDYYSFGPKPKAFVAEQMRLYFAAIPVRFFEVTDVKVRPGPKPSITTIIFETRYSARDFAGTTGTGHTRTEWDVVRRSDGLKITRTNWITYPDATPVP